MQSRIGYALMAIALLALAVWSISAFIQPILPSNINSSTVLFFIALLAATGFLAQFKDVLELTQMLRAHWHQSSRPQSGETSGSRVASLSESINARLKFLDTIDEKSKPDELQEAARDLVRFIEKVPQGPYFAQRIASLTGAPAQSFSISYVGDKNDIYPDQNEHTRRYRRQLREATAEIYALVDELLRLQ